MPGKQVTSFSRFHELRSFDEIIHRTFTTIRDINREKSYKVLQVKFERNNRNSNFTVIF